MSHVWLLRKRTSSFSPLLHLFAHLETCQIAKIECVTYRGSNYRAWGLRHSSARRSFA